MKLIFGRVNGVSGMRVLPRAEFTPDEATAGLPAVAVSLSRRGEGCVYSLGSLAEHDGHAPGWHFDGSSPSASSAPGVTVQAYVDRIVAAIRAAVPNAEVAVEFKDIVAPAQSNEDDGEGEDGDPDWGGYGVTH